MESENNVMRVLVLLLFVGLGVSGVYFVAQKINKGEARRKEKELIRNAKIQAEDNSFWNWAKGHGAALNLEEFLDEQIDLTSATIESLVAGKLCYARFFLNDSVKISDDEYTITGEGLSCDFSLSCSTRLATSLTNRYSDCIAVIEISKVSLVNRYEDGGTREDMLVQGNLIEIRCEN